MADRDFPLRPARKERQKDVAAHLPVQAAHAVDRPAASDRQVRHVEAFRGVVRVPAAQGQQIARWDAESLLGITTEVLLDEGRSKTVKAGGHCSVGSKKVPNPGSSQCGFE